MNPILMLAMAGNAKLRTVTITSSQSWVAPLGVSLLLSLTGQGAAGTPAGYSGDIFRNFTCDNVFGTSGSGGANSGSLSWSAFNTDASGAAATINGGGSGTVHGVTYFGFLGDNTYDTTLTTGTYSGSIPGSAAVSTSAGWKTSGAVLNGDSGTSSVSWREYGTTTPATTGASTTGFGKTFAGGVGGAATPATFTNLAVTGGTSYPLTVPAGGSLTFSYYA